MLISGQYIEDVYFMRCQASCCMTINFCGFFSCCTYLLITKVIYVLSAFSLSLFLLLFSGFRTEIVLVSSYLRKPWRGGDSLLCTVQVRDVLQPGGGWLSASMHKNLGSGDWGQGEEWLWIMPAGVKTSLWTHSLMPSFSILENRGKRIVLSLHPCGKPVRWSLAAALQQTEPSFLSCLYGWRREVEGWRGNNR